jgi:hypothetical protein
MAQTEPAQETPALWLRFHVKVNTIHESWPFWGKGNVFLP